MNPVEKTQQYVVGDYVDYAIYCGKYTVRATGRVKVIKDDLLLVLFVTHVNLLRKEDSNRIICLENANETWMHYSDIWNDLHGVGSHHHQLCVVKKSIAIPYTRTWASHNKRMKMLSASKIRSLL